jgi:hypothetical protein
MPLRIICVAQASSTAKYWRKSARAPGAEKELADIAVDRLRKLQLVLVEHDRIRPLPAIARFAIGHTDIRAADV